jgi:hypothetical protein
LQGFEKRNPGELFFELYKVRLQGFVELHQDSTLAV